MLLSLALACSDYNLDGTKDHAGRRDPSDREEVDTSAGLTTTEGTDTSTGGGTEPGRDTAAPDGRVDVVLLLDRAYWYDCYHADLPLQVGRLVDALFASGADVAVGITTYDDYQVDGQWMAADGGLPYVLVQQLTTDPSRLHTAAAAVTLEWGGDWQGSGYEALAQAARGRGFDQDCDGRYDADTDVRPFNASSSDAFGGAVTGAADSTVPGTGTIQGVGFRTDSARVFVLVAENGLRTAALGHTMPTGTCPGPASASSAAQELDSAKVKLLGVNTYEFQDIDPTLQDQLEELAQLTDSRWDANGDGNPSELAVLSGSWDWPRTDEIVRAIWELAD